MPKLLHARDHERSCACVEARELRVVDAAEKPGLGEGVTEGVVIWAGADDGYRCTRPARCLERELESLVSHDLGDHQQ